MAPQPILDLVEHFDRNASELRSSAYNETQLRREFSDPFFEALGWDVNNHLHYSETYKDVVHEPAREMDHGTPDYCFRVGGTSKFYVEAKKPAVRLKDNPEPALQLRRYAWSSKLPLSILSSFDELAIYDCRIPPRQSDKASTARIAYYTFQEYPAKWDEIASRFSKEAVLQGSFDRFVESSKAKKGTAEVDSAFLQDIQSWRYELAASIAARNPDLGQREVNFAVQRTIDRIIFLRICEDRGLERYGQLRDLSQQADVYEHLCELFRKGDERYNSGLFHFHKERDRAEDPDTITPKIKIDDYRLKPILKRLYYPDSPYAFSHVPADILGQVYEQFLGQVIRITPRRHVEIEPKPEVKKAGGVYYTPTYIVDYIVKNTVGNLVREKTLKQVAKLRVLDPACGSGSFLIGAYQFLLNWYRDEYVKDGPQKHKNEIVRDEVGNWRLTLDEKKKILIRHIYGVDIDTQAVEVTKLSLLLKVLEGESQFKLFHERALPDLGNNIKCGNSLIGEDFYEGKETKLLDQDELDRVNAFDWTGEFPDVIKDGGFDAVIGNPPYDVLEKDRGAASWPHTALREYVAITDSYFPALGGKLNLFRFFLVKSLAVAKESGRFGMIVPLALLADVSCANTRRFVISQVSDLVADCFPQKDNARRRVFLNAKLSTVVLTSTPSHKSDLQVRVNIYPWNSLSDTPRTVVVSLADTSLIDPKNNPIPLCTAAEWTLCKKIHKLPFVKRLGEVKDFSITRGEINQTVYRRFIDDKANHSRLVKGVEIGRYCLHQRLSQGQREWFNEQAYFKENPSIPAANVERIATQRITGVDEKNRLVAMLIQPHAYFADSTNSICLDPHSLYSPLFLLALLNSALFQWRFKLTSTNNNVGTNELACMPFRMIDFSREGDKKLHDCAVGMAEKNVRTQ